MELLISGAVVFGLIHLPPIIERISISFLAGLEGNLRLMGVLGQVYLQLVLYGLIAVFVLHLAMRGFWIGLLGLEGVVSFLSVDGLESGRHELIILAPPKVRLTDKDDKTPEPVRHLIPFWR